MLRNKPIRRPSTTPMGSSMYGNDFSLSVMAAGEEQRVFENKPRSGNGDLREVGTTVGSS